jgi:hypothetical protein
MKYSLRSLLLVALIVPPLVWALWPFAQMMLKTRYGPVIAHEISNPPLRKTEAIPKPSD